MSARHIEYRGLSAPQLIEIGKFHDFDWDTCVKHTNHVELCDHKEEIHKTVWDLYVEEFQERPSSFDFDGAGSGYHTLYIRYKYRVAMTLEDHEWEDDVLEFIDYRSN